MHCNTKTQGGASTEKFLKLMWRQANPFAILFQSVKFPSIYVGLTDDESSHECAFWFTFVFFHEYPSLLFV